MTINLDSLPLEIYKKIPLNIKTYKKEYELSELPYDIQNLIRGVNEEKTITYTDTVYDFEPIVSEFGDFDVIDSLRELVLKYMINYLYTSKGDYPFNGSVGSNVRKFIQTRDTTVRKLYLTEELNNMIQSFGTSIDQSIEVKDFKVTKNGNDTSSEYILILSLLVGGESTGFQTSFVL